MGELINGRTPEKILFNIRECAYGACLSECPYDGSDDCMEELLNDALAMIRHLEAKRPKWINVKERLPKKGDVCAAIVECERGGTTMMLFRFEAPDKWIDIYWAEEELYDRCFAITHWMPLHEPPKGE